MDKPGRAEDWYNNNMLGKVAVEQYATIGSLKRTDYELYLEVGRWAIATHRMYWYKWENDPNLTSLWHKAYPDGMPASHIPIGVET